MKKLPLDKVTGAVALAYLVLIPAAGYYMWQRVKAIDNDVVALCDHAGITVTDNVTPIDTFSRSFKRFLRSGKK